MKLTSNDKKFILAVVIIALVVIIATWYYIAHMNPEQQDVSQVNNFIGASTIQPTKATERPTVVPTTVTPTMGPQIFMDDYLQGETCDNRNVLDGEEAIKIMQFFGSINRTLNSNNILNAEDYVDMQLLQQLQDRKKRVVFVPGKTINQMVVSTRNGVVVMENVTATALPTGNKAYRLWVKDPMTKNGNIYVIAVYNCQDQLVSVMEVIGGVTKKIQGGFDSGSSDGASGNEASNDVSNGGDDDGGDQDTGGPVDATV